MAKPTEVALSKQLQREVKHQLWLRKNLPHTAQQKSQRKIFVLRTQLVVQLQRSVDQ